MATRTRSLVSSLASAATSLRPAKDLSGKTAPLRTPMHPAAHAMGVGSERQAPDQLRVGCRSAANDCSASRLAECSTSRREMRQSSLIILWACGDGKGNDPKLVMPSTAEVTVLFANSVSSVVTEFFGKLLGFSDQSSSRGVRPPRGWRRVPALRFAPPQPRVAPRPAPRRVYCSPLAPARVVLRSHATLGIVSRRARERSRLSVTSDKAMFAPREIISCN